MALDSSIIRKEDVHPIKDFSKFKDFRNSLQGQTSIIEDDESMTDNSIESWCSAKESQDSKSYYDCIQDSKFLSNDLILSSSVTSFFISTIW